MLAETEIAAKLNEGIADGLYSRLTGGKIPMMEVGLRMRAIQSAIETSESGLFRSKLSKLSGGFYVPRGRAASLKENFDPANPPRGEIPD